MNQQTKLTERLNRKLSTKQQQHLVTCALLSALQVINTCSAINVSHETPQIQMLKPAQSSSKPHSSFITTTTEGQSQAPTPLPSQVNQSASSVQPPDSALIESILIRVERLNEQRSAVYESASSSSSLAPTDSGEDPLEASTLIPPASSNQTEHVDSSSQIVSNNNSNSRLDQNLDEEELLLNSNKLSAALQPSVSQRPPPAPDQLIQTTKQSPISCVQAYSQCAHRKACAPALRAYNDDCRALINNGTSQCTGKCLKAMIALRSSEEGEDLVNCDCQNDAYCLQSKQRSLACRPQVEEAINPRTQVSCSTANWICNADQLCSTALEYYYSYCQTLFSFNRCSMRCNNSLSILYRQPKASKLLNCKCDGTEDFPCSRYRTYTERLCLHSVSSTTLDSVSSNSEDLDDSSNMTNEPDTLLQNSHILGESSNTDEDEEYEDMMKAQDSVTSYPSNTEFQLEDNWIPFLSGRYFTNLLQQQQQLQQQVTRKPQKGAKQKIKLNSNPDLQTNDYNTRRRHSRIYFSASTASSASPPAIIQLLSVWYPFRIVVLCFITHIVFTSLLLH